MTLGRLVSAARSHVVPGETSGWNGRHQDRTDPSARFLSEKLLALQSAGSKAPTAGWELPSRVPHGTGPEMDHERLGTHLAP